MGLPPRLPMRVMRGLAGQAAARDGVRAVTGYLIRRLLQTIVVTLIVTVITFVLLHLVPGGEVRAVLGIRATAQEIAIASKAWGFDKPLYVQYGKWLWRLVHGNFGYDLPRNAPVATLMWAPLVRTILLAFTGTGVGLLIGIPLGILQAGRRYSVIDHVITGISFIGYGAPTFFVGLLLVQWFAFDLHIFPPFAPQAAYPGMGLLFYEAALGTDIQLMLAITLLTTLVTILANLLADICFAMLDPRVRYT